MALKKNEQLLIDSILQTAKIVQGIVGNDISMINEKLEEMLAGFYQETQKKLILSVDDDGKVSYRVADYKSDFVRTRTNTEKTLLSLKGKLFIDDNLTSWAIFLDFAYITASSD